MLKHLQIKNFALIDNCEVDFSDKLNIQYEDAKEWRDVCLGYFLKFAEGEK